MTLGRTAEGLSVLLTSPPPNSAAFDVCVVGAGPTGLTVALETARRGARVLLVEGGSADRETMGGTPQGVDHVVDDAHHVSLGETTWRGVGGASWLWGGRCVPFDPIDFTMREHVPYSGWPLSSADVAPFQERAAGYLDCGASRFSTGPIPGWPEERICTTQKERWSRRPQLAHRLGAQVAAHPAVSVLPNTTVTDIRLNPEGKAVTGLRARHRLGDAEVTAGTYVLACGGVATTRLLLGVQRRLPMMFGGTAGPLGCFYMGHLTGCIATILLNQPDDFPDLDFALDSDGTWTRRRFAVSEAAQRAHGILNTSFHLGNLPFGDPQHGNGALSLFFLLLSVPGLGRRLVPAETLRRNLGPRSRGRRRHLANIGRHPLRTVADVARIVRLRSFASPRRQVFVLRSEAGAYALRYHAEQVPNPDSRVTLNGGIGPDGLPGVDIDFRYSEQDVASVLKAHALLDAELRAAGYGRLLYRYPEAEHVASVRAQATDGFHQIGTTRMSADPREGVVDRDCRVHGVANLFIASSSVFPTAGEANPTFMAVTLAVRLAQHLTSNRAPAS